MKPQDWKKQHSDAFSARTLLIEIGCSSFNFLVYIIFLPKIDWVPVLTEFVGICAAMDQIYHILEKKAGAHGVPVGDSHNGRARILLLIFFWAHVVLLNIFFYRILHFHKVEESGLANIGVTLLTVAALIARLYSVIYPFGRRIVSNIATQFMLF
jgi:hypothetical protein